MTFSDRWLAYDGIHGGYVIGRVLSAAADAVPSQRPLSLQVQFIGTVVAGAAELRCAIKHQGRRTATVDVEVLQGGSRLHGTAKLGTDVGGLIIAPGLDLSSQPDPSAVHPVAPVYGDLTYDRHLDTRIVEGIGSAAMTGTAAWIRFRGDRAAVDGLGAVGLAPVLLDALPPGLFGHDPAPVFVPTIDFSLHLAPAAEVVPDEWYFVRQRTVWATRTFCLEEATAHTASGSLVAQCRQTRRVQWI